MFRIGSPTALLFIYLVVTAMMHAVYSFQKLDEPSAYTALQLVGFIWITGWWLESDARKRGFKWPMDLGLFINYIWPLIVPYYLFKTRGAKGFLAILTIIGVYLGGLLVGTAVSVLLTS